MFLQNVDKIILEFKWKGKGIKIAKTISKKNNKVEENI